MYKSHSRFNPAGIFSSFDASPAKHGRALSNVFYLAGFNNDGGNDAEVGFVPVKANTLTASL